MLRTALIIGTAMALAGVAIAQPPAPPDLAGLWAARSIRMPVRGTLLIIDRGGALTADIAGFVVPIQRSGESPCAST